jgi:NAD(P)-dependent dehydrogenase (short-subunit alcohol dehydrogenase family)
MEIAGAVALVTGGASGLGEATSRRLHAAGAKVVVADVHAERGKTLAEELGIVFVPSDVTDPDQVQAAVARAGELGPLRAAVSCAGVGWASKVVGRGGRPHELDLFRRTIEINLVGTFNVLRLAAAAMTGNEPQGDGERGVVVNTASTAAFDGQIGQVAYAASKAAVVGLTLPAARDLADTGVRVVTIAPGTFDTPMLAQLPDEARAGLASLIPFPRRLGIPEDFAALVEHVVGNTYLNGETIRLDGALRMPPR